MIASALLLQTLVMLSAVALESQVAVLDRSRDRWCLATFRELPPKVRRSSLAVFAESADTHQPIEGLAERFDSEGDAPTVTGFASHGGIIVVPLIAQETGVIVVKDGFLPVKPRFGSGSFCIEARLAVKPQR